MATDQIKTQALAYARQGWFILPVLPHSKEPHFDLVKNGHLSATRDLHLIDSWFREYPDANYGIACAPSGLVVVDIDFRNGGKRSASMSETFTVKTGNGLHLYYQAPEGMAFRGKLTNGIDIKHQGYVVGPQSLHPNGKRYFLKDEMAPALLPADLRASMARVRVAA